VYDATERWLRADPTQTFRVADEGTVVGTISLQSASRTTAGRPVREAMMSLSDRSTVGADESLSDAFEWVAGNEARVDDTAGTVGVIDVGDIDRWLQAHWSKGTFVDRPAGVVLPPRPDL
jgi:hypothetical protein